MMKKILCFCAALTATFALSAQEVGLQLYSLRNQFKKDVSGTLDLIKSWDIVKIEGGDSYGLPVAEFKAMLAERNFDIVSVQGGYLELKDDLNTVIQRAKDYDAEYVMCAWIDHKGDEFGISNTKEAVEVFNSAGKRLKEKGITLVYHPHGYEFRPYKNGTLFDYMAANAEHFDFEMDVYWFRHGGADPMAMLNKYPDKFKLMHLKDMQKGTKGNNTGHSDVETNVVLGTGQIDIAALVKRGKELGIEYMFIEDESSRSVKQIPQSLSFLQSIK
ncbi:sugar phosphate isomerase/epimerase family protein [Costertonia aggregata]|uniref:TIM barrel protein n=1 Tax=Costertonia aggregata TaxID=343403 RepID=A0A7H9ATA2_9FLAO|nr:sugar phosphate isomerase/epimerase [Costertonia aggregata]QLG46656.1 TIM barrel protein [Costertonia aggregata]